MPVSSPAWKGCLVVQDPVDASPAVLVKRYNITQQKHIELQLTAHQEALQRWVAAPAPRPLLLHKVFVNKYRYRAFVRCYFASNSLTSSNAGG